LNNIQWLGIYRDALDIKITKGQLKYRGNRPRDDDDNDDDDDVDGEWVLQFQESGAIFQTVRWKSWCCN